MRHAARVAATVILFALTVLPAAAIDIKEVKSKAGIIAWLVEDHTNPLIAMQYSFAGGTAADPAGKEGLAHFLSGMLDEGAGDLDSKTFQTKRDDLGMRMGFDDDSDQFEGTFQTLSEKRDEAFGLLRLALTKPRFDADPLERVRQQLLVGAEQNLQDPDRIASAAWMKAALGDHPYTREGEGTPQSLARITAADLRGLHRNLFTRKGLEVAVVGDIDAATLARLLDETFGDLPDTDPPPEPPMAKVADTPSLKIIDRNIPQSVIDFGNPGILRNDPDFIPAYVTSFILGGGGFGSRLTEEVREKRGLTYGVSLGLYPLDRAGLVLGQVGTRNEKAGEALAVVRDTMQRFASEGPTADELADAKTYLTGSYALRFTSNTKIASQLLGLQEENLGIDYVNRRNGLIEAVTLDQTKEQAKRLVQPDRMTIVILGKPQGVTQ
ncbi:pitrilysin family protein [soil metagenome]